MKLYLTLLEKGPDFTFTHDDTPALAVVSKATVKTLLENLRAAGVIERVRVKPGTVKRERVGNGGYTGARCSYRLTGKPYEPVGSSGYSTGLPFMNIVRTSSEELEPRVIRVTGPLPRWRSVGSWLLGDPPIGRSALDRRRLGSTPPLGFSVFDIARFA